MVTFCCVFGWEINCKLNAWCLLYFHRFLFLIDQILRMHLNFGTGGGHLPLLNVSTVSATQCVVTLSLSLQ